MPSLLMDIFIKRNGIKLVISGQLGELINHSSTYAEMRSMRAQNNCRETQIGRR